jgi:hypothetical protein
MKMNIQPIGLIALCTTLLPGLALAGPPDEAESGGEASLEASADASSQGSGDRADQPWIKRWAPEGNMAEIGVYGGVLLPTPNHEWFGADLDLPQQGFKPLASIAPDVGIRAAITRCVSSGSRPRAE